MPHRPHGRKGTKWAPVCDGCGEYHFRVDCPYELHGAPNLSTPWRGGRKATPYYPVPQAPSVAGLSYFGQTNQRTVSTASQVPSQEEPATNQRTPTPPASTEYAKQHPSPKSRTGSAHSGLTPTSQAAALVTTRDVATTRALSPQSSASVPGGYPTQHATSNTTTGHALLNDATGSTAARVPPRQRSASVQSDSPKQHATSKPATVSASRSGHELTGPSEGPRRSPTPQQRAPSPSARPGPVDSQAAGTITAGQTPPASQTVSIDDRIAHLAGLRIQREMIDGCVMYPCPVKDCTSPPTKYSSHAQRHLDSHLKKAKEGKPMNKPRKSTNTSRTQRVARLARFKIVPVSDSLFDCKHADCRAKSYMDITAAESHSKSHEEGTHGFRVPDGARARRKLTGAGTQQVN